MEREQPSRFLRVEVKLDQTLQYLIRQATRKLAARVHSLEPGGGAERARLKLFIWL